MATLKIKKLLFWLLLVGGFVALGSVMLRPPPYTGPINKRAPNIYLPDALIRTYSLSRLPPDLLQIPLAHDVLTEDFVTYYEQNENRMAFSGTLRRIAFEHELNLPERLLESILDGPAEVALWRDEGGRLKDFVIVLSRNSLVGVVQALLPLAAKATDMQLSSAGTLEGMDGVEILALKYGAGQHLLLLSKGDRLIVLSNPGMLLASKESQLEKAVEIIQELLKGAEGVSPFARHFQIEKPLAAIWAAKQHELTLGARAFALNYESFVPGLAALSLAFDGHGDWQSAALLAGNLGRDDDNASLWAALPHGPGFCAALPVDWAQMATLLEKFDASVNPGSKPDSEPVPAQPGSPKEFAASFTGPAAVCWYKDSRLYAPLFAARMSASADEKKVKAFFDLATHAIKAKEPEESIGAGNRPSLWKGEIDSRFGSPDSEGNRSLKPTLVIQGNIAFFSPDAALVENVLAVAEKHYPSIADSFPSRKDAPLAFFDPARLASLLRDETFTALPRDEEALFRNAADVYLVPRLEALARYPARAVGLTGKVNGADFAWHPLEWREVKAP
jgi:uncharacterized protein YfaA (DUF2138 family)